MQTRTKIVVTIGVLVCCIGLALRVSHKPPAREPSTAAIPVRVIDVRQQDVPRSLMGIGTVLSLHSVTIRPQIDGVLTRIAVKEGQQVQRGDLLATIDDRAIRASLEQAQAQLGQSQAQLKVAQIDLKRYRQLSDDKGISQQTLDQQQALADQLLATVKGNQASIAAAQVQLSYTQIHSPVTGRVGIRNLDEGNFLRVGDTQGLFSVTQLDPIAVEFALPQQHLTTLQTLARQTPPAKAQALIDDGDGHTSVLAEGELSLIDNQISASTGTLRAKAEFANAGHKLWPGQLVNIKLQTLVQHNALVVPVQVVQRGVDVHYVYRVKGDVVESVPVKVLFQDSSQSVIEGVAQGDVLVSDGQSRIKPGSKVQPLRQTPQATDTFDVRPQP